MGTMFVATGDLVRCTSKKGLTHRYRIGRGSLIVIGDENINMGHYESPDGIEELHGLYHSPNIIRVIKSRRLRWAGHVARTEEGRVAYKIVTGKCTGKCILERSRRRWEDNIRMDLKEVNLVTRN